MIKRELLTTDVTRLKKIFERDFPDLTALAVQSENADAFKVALKQGLILQMQPEGGGNEIRNVVAGRILFLIENDNRLIDELSTGEKISIRTLTYFWQFLAGFSPSDLSPDFLIDLYYQFTALKHAVPIVPDVSKLKRQMNRWPSGLDEEVLAVRERNKKRIIGCLVHKIERHYGSSSRYQFEEGMTEEEKYDQVGRWWNEARFHLSMAVKSPTELNAFLGHTLSVETIKLLLKGKRKGMPFFVTPYYLSLLNIEQEGYDDATVRSYILYSAELIETYGEIKAWEKEDTVEAGIPNAAGWLLPEGHNIHRRYPEVAILIPDSMGRACGGLCASCQRMYDFQSERLNFDFEALKPKESWDKKLRRLMRYFEEDTQLRDILITGGDALMSQNATLRKILDAVYKMALRKREANRERPSDGKYAELQRVRLGSRLPAYLPLRITGELVGILREFREKAQTAGISQFYIQTHFQSPLEVTPQAKQAIEALQTAGWTVTNQLVYTVSASRRGHTAKLRRVLNSLGVVCYYTFSVKGFRENYAVFAPNCRSLQEAAEEKIFGRIPEEKRGELLELICRGGAIGQPLMRFLKTLRLPFAATDRNVLNLPAIGKSMTFRLAGLTPDGRRILRFEHDGSRRHSPIIDRMGEVYIVENKSVAAYLRQLAAMGEQVEEYRTLWQYCEGQTEPRFSLYDYPAFPFDVTEETTHLGIAE